MRTIHINPRCELDGPLHHFPWALVGATLLLGTMMGVTWLRYADPATFESIASHVPLYKTDWVD